MAETVVTPVALVRDVASVDIAMAGGTAINPANTMHIPYKKQDKLLILVNNTFAGEKKVTVKAGDFLAKGQGDLVVPILQNEVVALVLSSDRFKNADGNVVLEFEESMTGFVRALTLPFVA